MPKIFQYLEVPYKSANSTSSLLAICSMGYQHSRPIFSGFWSKKVHHCGYWLLHQMVRSWTFCTYNWEEGQELCKDYIINWFRIHCVIITDNGRQFNNYRFKDFYTQYHIIYRLTFVRRPQSNDEAVINRTILYCLKTNSLIQLCGCIKWLMQDDLVDM